MVYIYVFYCKNVNDEYYHVVCLGLPATGGSLSVAGGKKAEPQAALADADADLEERLNNLRRD